MGEKMSDLVMVNMQKAIRMKHYSLSTERTYVDWARHFFDYAGNMKGGFDKTDLSLYLPFADLITGFFR